MAFEMKSMHSIEFLLLKLEVGRYYNMKKGDIFTRGSHDKFKGIK